MNLFEPKIKDWNNNNSLQRLERSMNRFKIIMFLVIAFWVVVLIIGW